MEIQKTEMDKLVDLLAQTDIPFGVRLHSLFPSTIQVCIPNAKDCKIDVVCFPGSYGWQEGLLEMMEWDTENVKGHLTANEAFNIIYDEIKGEE